MPPLPVSMQRGVNSDDILLSHPFDSAQGKLIAVLPSGLHRFTAGFAVDTDAILGTNELTPLSLSLRASSGLRGGRLYSLPWRATELASSYWRFRR